MFISGGRTRMSNFLEIHHEGPIAILTMNRPQTRNALSDDDAIAAIVAACAAINTDLDTKVVILTGTETVFSSGGNLKTLRNQMGSGLGEPVMSRYAYRNGIQQLPRALYDLEVPTIAAVNGAAIGAGNDLACMCDIRIASENARFAESFVTLGLTAGDGGAWLLPRIVGMSQACQMTFTGEAITAQQALACGLVSTVVTEDELMETALTLARAIAANSGHALRMSKRLLREGQQTSLSTLLEMSASFQALAHHTQEHETALETFARRTRK